MPAYREDCQSTDSAVWISGCTAIIDAGKAEDRAWAYYNRGRAYRSKGGQDLAIKDFDQATALDPKNAAAYLHRGYSYDNKGETARALSDFDMAILADPKNAEAYNNRCWLRALKGMDLGTARADCDAAIAIKSDYSAALDSRGLLGIKQGKFAEAWDEYDAAVRAGLESFPEDTVIASFIYGRGIAALRLGRTADSKADLAKATEPDSNIAKAYAVYGVTP